MAYEYQDIFGANILSRLGLETQTGELIEQPYDVVRDLLGDIVSSGDVYVEVEQRNATTYQR
jgi:hypothetical protein